MKFYQRFGHKMLVLGCQMPVHDYFQCLVHWRYLDDTGESRKRHGSVRSSHSRPRGRKFNSRFAFSFDAPRSRVA
jgi:hypothetical protein